MSIPKASDIYKKTLQKFEDKITKKLADHISNLSRHLSLEVLTSLSDELVLFTKNVLIEGGYVVKDIRFVGSNNEAYGYIGGEFDWKETWKQCRKEIDARPGGSDYLDAKTRFEEAQ